MNMIGISTNLDNTSVGIAYGLKNTHIPFWFNMIVNSIGFCFALIGAYSGSMISQFISPREAGILSCCVLFGIGIFIIYSEYCFLVCGNKLEVKVGKIGIRQAIFLGFALSFTNIASGFGLTVINESMIWLTIISITIWGYIAIWFGNVVGNRIVTKILGKYSSLIGGLILITLALKQIL
ncbi:manganese efflux pump MntP [Lederbergia citrisecunda]